MRARCRAAFGMPLPGFALRAHRLDAALLLLGAAIGLPSLMFPFGWDTAVHYYVGREWALRGAVPYRDTFDHKTPGIHFVHAVCVTVFGERMWPIRLVELACVVAIGVMSADLVRGSRPRHPRDTPLRGLGVFISCVFVYGFFDYGNTAQCELIATALAMSSMLCARRGWLVAAGVLSGASALTKPSGVLLVVPFVAASPRRSAARSLSRLALGATLIWFVTVAYFAAKGALPAMVECVLGANARYVTSEGPRFSLVAIVRIGAEHFRHFSPVSTEVMGVVLAGTVVARFGSAKHRAGWGIALALMLSAILTVFAQRKFFPYHWSPLVAGVAAAMIAFALETPRQMRSWAAAGIAGSFAFAFTQTGPQYRVWRSSVAVVAARVSGRIGDDALAAHFVTMPGGNKWLHAREVGLFVRSRAEPGDLLAMRGVSAEIYAVSGCASPTRFFWTSFLTSPTRAYRRDAWLAEDAAALARRPPRWMVVTSTEPLGPNEAALLRDGDFIQTRIGSFLVFERPRDSSPTKVVRR